MRTLSSIPIRFLPPSKRTYRKIFLFFRTALFSNDLCDRKSSNLQKLIFRNICTFPIFYFRRQDYFASGAILLLRLHALRFARAYHVALRASTISLHFSQILRFPQKRRPSDTRARALALTCTHVSADSARVCTHTFVRLISGI